MKEQSRLIVVWGASHPAHQGPLTLTTNLAQTAYAWLAGYAWCIVALLCTALQAQQHCQCAPSPWLAALLLVQHWGFPDQQKYVLLPCTVCKRIKQDTAAQYIY